MKRRVAPWQALALGVVLAAGLLLAPHVGRGQAAPADAGLVLEALGVLDQHYVDPVDRVRLLNAALTALERTLAAAGVTITLEPLPAGTTDTEADRLFRARFDAAQAAAQGKLSVQALAYAAIRGMTATFNDSHTGFMTPEQYTERLRKQRREAFFSGVGIVLLPNEGRFYVRDVIPNTPAQRAGVRRFDRILRVGDVSTSGLEVDQVVNLIRGPEGTSVTLTLQRPGRPTPLVVTVVRAPIEMPSVFAAEMVQPGIGYVQLYQFVEGTTAEMRAALGRLLGQGMRALVLDVRGNSGGFLHELRGTLNLLLPAGLPIYQETTRGGQTTVVRTRAPAFLPRTVPMVVLVDEGSASAAELLAAALKEHGRALIVGTKTAGAVEASTLYRLSDGSALSVTILRMRSAKGARLEREGVTPHVTLELTVEDLERGVDPPLARAVQLARQRVAAGRRPTVAQSPRP